jgi:hypothetical protein
LGSPKGALDVFDSLLCLDLLEIICDILFDIIRESFDKLTDESGVDATYA